MFVLKTQNYALHLITCLCISIAFQIKNFKTSIVFNDFSSSNVSTTQYSKALASLSDLCLHKVLELLNIDTEEKYKNERRTKLPFSLL